MRRKPLPAFLRPPPGRVTTTATIAWPGTTDYPGVAAYVGNSTIPVTRPDDMTLYAGDLVQLSRVGDGTWLVTRIIVSVAPQDLT